MDSSNDFEGMEPGIMYSESGEFSGAEEDESFLQDTYSQEQSGMYSQDTLQETMYFIKEISNYLIELFEERANVVFDLDVKMNRKIKRIGERLDKIEEVVGKLTVKIIEQVFG
ncbi:MAG: hypothetical protein ABIG28_02930 [archaeon]